MSNHAHQAGWKTVWLRKEASTAIAAGELVARSASGDVEPAAAADSELIGISLRAVVATDSDYATNAKIPVHVPMEKGAAMVSDVTTGTIAVTDEGAEFDIDAASGVDASASSTDAVKLIKFINSTKGVFAINQPDLV